MANFLVGFLFIIVPGLLLFAFLIQSSAKLFFKKEKLKGNRDLTMFFDALGLAFMMIIVSAIIRLLFFALGILGDLLVVAFLGGMFFRYYHIKIWWKPFAISLVIGVIMTIFSAIITFIGLRML